DRFVAMRRRCVPAARAFMPWSRKCCAIARLRSRAQRYGLAILRYKAVVTVLLMAALVGLATAAENPDADQALPWGSAPSPTAAYARASAIAALGRQMFSDKRLSASGAMSCATCHDPGNHFAPANSLAVQRGGPRLDQPGTRAASALTYTATTPFFTEHYFE